MGGWYRKNQTVALATEGLKMRLGGRLFGEACLGIVPQNMPLARCTGS
jgi:TRAP-type mannitol/chloroaromatic compound transport system substrate-binding protein